MYLHSPYEMTILPISKNFKIQITLHPHSQSSPLLIPQPSLYPFANLRRLHLTGYTFSIVAARQDSGGSASPSLPLHLGCTSIFAAPPFHCSATPPPSHKQIIKKNVSFNVTVYTNRIRKIVLRFLQTVKLFFFCGFNKP